MARRCDGEPDRILTAQNSCGHAHVQLPSLMDTALSASIRPRSEGCLACVVYRRAKVPFFRSSVHRPACARCVFRGGFGFAMIFI